MNIRELRFLSDENVDRELVAFLRVEGMDVLDIKEDGLFRLSDRSILEMALSHQRVVISQDSDFGVGLEGEAMERPGVVISQDSDFGTLIFRDQIPFYGVIFLRPGHESPELHIQSMAVVLEAGLEIAPPFILVVENTGDAVRLRFRNF